MLHVAATSVIISSSSLPHVLNSRSLILGLELSVEDVVRGEIFGSSHIINMYEKMAKMGTATENHFHPDCCLELTTEITIITITITVNYKYIPIYTKPKFTYILFVLIFDSMLLHTSDQITYPSTPMCISNID